jgi:putative IMPACT (imprinted ancient) family translation regulator
VHVPQPEAEKASSSASRIVLVAELPRGYPSRSPPDLQLSTSTGETVPAEIAEGALVAFANLWADAAGEVMLFECVSWLEERLKHYASKREMHAQRQEAAREARMAQHAARQENALLLASNLMGRFAHGETLIDRKSVFQAHVARLESPDDVDLLIGALKSDKKIARATHNMVAWRCGRASDNDDDGESAAGRRLAELLSLAGAENVLVVVSRWYGGIHLGPDRFKHINNVARALLVKEGFVGRGGSARSGTKQVKSTTAAAAAGVRNGKSKKLSGKKLKKRGR